MRSAALGSFALAVVSSISPALSADWPQFRGPSGSGISTEKGVPLKWDGSTNILWKADLPGPGTSSPIIVGQRIFLTSWTGRSSGDPARKLVCLNRADGKTLWTRDIESALPEQDNIRENHGYASATCVADNEHVYAFFGKSGVHAYTLDGKFVWKKFVGDRLNGWGSSNSPVILDDLLIINASIESNSLYAFNRKTGEQVWKTGGINESWNSPILVDAGGRKDLVVAMQGKVLGFNPKTGTQVWDCKTGIGWYMVPNLVAADGFIGVVGGRSGVGALAIKAGGTGDITGSHRLWTSTKGSNVPSPILTGGKMYWVNENLCIVYCAEIATGNILSETRLERAGQVYASLVLADGKIYCLARTGKMFVLEAAPGTKVLAVNEIPERAVWNATPAIAGGRMYLRSEKTLYCIGTK